MKTPHRILLSVLIGIAGVSPALADDWPHWLGPKGDAIWRESSVMTTLPASGPKVLWRIPVGLGYSGPSVTDQHVYVYDFTPSANRNPDNEAFGAGNLPGKERIQCLDVKTGKTVWEHSYDCVYAIAYPGGPRCTVTIADGRAYALGAMGHFRCLDAATGELQWSVLLTEEYKTEPPRWGYASHPFVHDGLVYVLAGGKGSVVVAFDAATGKEKWRALDARTQGYCPVSLIHAGGVDQLLAWHPESLNSLDPKTGELHWSKPLKPSWGVATAAPRLQGNKLFVSGPGFIAGLLELAKDKPEATFLWRGKPKTAVYAVNTTPFVDGDVIYGADVESSLLMGVDLATGKRLWETKEPTLAPTAPARARHGTAFIVKHEPSGRFFLFNENGELIIAELSREGYKEISRAALLEPTNEAFGRPVVWSHPAFAHRSVFARNDKELIRVDLSKP